MDHSKGRNQPIIPQYTRINSYLSGNLTHLVEPSANSTLRVDEEKKVKRLMQEINELNNDCEVLTEELSDLRMNYECNGKIFI
jgi:hypothetical protein